MEESWSNGAVCGKNEKKIKKKKGKCQCKEKPPKVLSFFSHLEKQLVALYLRDFDPAQQCVERLHLIVSTFEDDLTRASGAVMKAARVEVAGGLVMGLGLALAPVHRGISALITGAGAAVISGAAIADKLWNQQVRSLQNRLIQDSEAEMRTFRNKISPMMGTMSEIRRCVHEILRDLSQPERDVGYLNKYFSSAGELVRFLQIYDISVLAPQITSQTSCFTGVYFLGALPLRTALQLTWIEMVQLQNAMEEITKTIDRITNQPE